jgi:hypothetical protein
MYNDNDYRLSAVNSCNFNHRFDQTISEFSITIVINVYKKRKKTSEEKTTQDGKKKKSRRKRKETANFGNRSSRFFRTREDRIGCHKTKEIKSESSSTSKKKEERVSDQEEKRGVVFSI